MLSNNLLVPTSTEGFQSVFELSLTPVMDTSDERDQKRSVQAWVISLLSSTCHS